MVAPVVGSGLCACRGQHLLARLLCGCLCGAAGITGRPFTPAQTAIRSPSLSPALSSIIPLLWFSPKPPPLQITVDRTVSFTSTNLAVCLSVCLCFCLCPPLFPFPSFWLCHRLFASHLTQKHKQPLQLLYCIIISRIK